jgi:hypothetical protein
MVLTSLPEIDQCSLTNLKDDVGEKEKRNGEVTEK